MVVGGGWCCLGGWRRRWRLVSALKTFEMRVIRERKNDMSDNDVTHERQVADLPEAQRLIDAIRDAMWAYKTFLEKHGLIWNADWEEEGSLGDPLKAKKLIAEINFEYPDCGQVVDVHLAGGALDRAYSDQPLDDEGRPRRKH
jgi:hypothetical protein